MDVHDKVLYYWLFTVLIGVFTLTILWSCFQHQEKMLKLQLEYKSLERNETSNDNKSLERNKTIND